MRHVVSYVFSSPLLFLPLSESLSESPRVSLLRYIILLSARRPLGTKGSTAVPDIAQNCAGRHPGAREYARQTTRRIGSNTRACSGGQLETTRSKKDIKDDAIKIMIMHRPSCVKFHRPVAQKSVALVGLIRVRRCRLSSLGIRQLHHTLDALQSLRAIAWRHSHISRRVSDTVHWQVSDSLSVCARAPCVRRARARVEGYRRRGHRSGRGQGG